MTNFHIAGNLTQDDIKNSDLIQEGSPHTLKIKQIKHLSTQYDLAVLEIEGEVSDYLNINKEIPQPDEDIFSIGYPAIKFSVIKKTSDIFSRDESSYSFFGDHSDIPGASGSPLLNLKGEVVGVIHAAGVNVIHAINTIHLENLLSEEIKSFENLENHVAYAIEKFKKAAFQGYAEAQFELGTLYEKGIGVVKQDLKEAAYWYEEAAEQGHQKAKAQLKRLSTLK